MEYKDYYKLLGVERTVSEDVIRRAYRKLAMKYHPDRNPGNKQAEDKFKEINEAYQVLSDPEKRTRYDQLGESYSNWQQRGEAPGGFNWEDWVSRSPGGGVRVEDLDDLLGGAGMGEFSDFFRRIFGGMRDAGERSTNRRGTGSSSQGESWLPRQGNRIPRQAYQQPVTISLQEAYQGTTCRLDIDGRQIEVKIPPGARNETKIRVPETVPTGPNQPKSDLFLLIQVSDDPRFERKGNDLHTTLSVEIYAAVLGGEVTIPTLTGNVVLTLPSGTQTGQTFRLSGRGMPLLKNPEQHGDLYAHITVQIPRNLNARQRELFEELAKSSK